MHTIKITPNLLFEYRCTSCKFIRLPNRIESKLFCPNWNALLAWWLFRSLPPMPITPWPLLQQKRTRSLSSVSWWVGRSCELRDNYSLRSANIISNLLHVDTLFRHLVIRSNGRKLLGSCVPGDERSLCGRFFPGNVGHTSSSHLPTEFSQPPNLHICITSSKFSLLATLALHLWFFGHTRSPIHIIFFTNNSRPTLRSFLPVCFPSSLESTPGSPPSTPL